MWEIIWLQNSVLQETNRFRRDVWNSWKALSYGSDRNIDYWHNLCQYSRIAPVCFIQILDSSYALPFDWCLRSSIHCYMMRRSILYWSNAVSWNDTIVMCTLRAFELLNFWTQLLTDETSSTFLFCPRSEVQVPNCAVPGALSGIFYPRSEGLAEQRNEILSASWRDTFSFQPSLEHLHWPMIQSDKRPLKTLLFGSVAPSIPHPHRKENVTYPLCTNCQLVNKH